MKTSLICTVLFLFGLTPMLQAKDAATKKEFKGHVTLLKRDAAPGTGDSLQVQPDNGDGTQEPAAMSQNECEKMHGTWKDGRCILLRESPSKAASSDLQIGTCRSCSGACSSCSPPKCACPDISTSRTTAAGMDAQSPATAIDTGTTSQPAGTTDSKVQGNPKGYDLKVNKKL